MPEEKPAPFLEGLAAVGKVKRYWEEDCGTPLRKKIYVETSGGEVYHTPCIDHRAAKKVILAIAEYIRLSTIIVQRGDRA